jgi:hypothetical protein
MASNQGCIDQGVVPRQHGRPIDRASGNGVRPGRHLRRIFEQLAHVVEGLAQDLLEGRSSANWCRRARLRRP